MARCWWKMRTLIVRDSKRKICVFYSTVLLHRPVTHDISRQPDVPVSGSLPELHGSLDQTFSQAQSIWPVAAQAEMQAASSFCLSLFPSLCKRIRFGGSLLPPTIVPYAELSDPSTISIIARRNFTNLIIILPKISSLCSTNESKLK
jgi:hypothetical protein